MVAAKDQDRVKTTSLFDNVELPKFDVEAIRQLLLTDLPELDRIAEAQVRAHLLSLIMVESHG